MSEKLEYCLKKYKFNIQHSTFNIQHSTFNIQQLDEEEKGWGLDKTQEQERETYKAFLSELEQIKEETIL